MLGKNLKAIAALLTAAILIITGCSMTTGTSKTEESDAATTTENTGLSGNVNGMNYACTRENEYGPDLDRGWYIRDAEGERYILICHGMEGGGGHGIHVTDISNDGDTVVISVVDTYDRDMPTDAITHPCCYVEFSKIPEKIKVMVTSENYEIILRIPGNGDLMSPSTKIIRPFLSEQESNTCIFIKTTTAVTDTLMLWYMRAAKLSSKAAESPLISMLLILRHGGFKRIRTCLSKAMRTIRYRSKNI